MWKFRSSVVTTFAGFRIRLAAFLVDVIILVAIIWVFNGLWGLASGAGWMVSTGVDPLAADVVGATGLWLLRSLIVFLIVVAYLVCFWAWRGQTPGKMLLRLKIVRIDGSDIDWGVAVIRFLSYIMSVVLLFIGYLWVAFDAYKQGLHDKMADTYVIRVPRK